MINIKHNNGRTFYTPTTTPAPAIAAVYDWRTERHERVQPYAVRIVRKTARFMHVMLKPTL